jgi:hypothetical protein
MIAAIKFVQFCPSTSIIAKSDLADSKKANTSRSNAHSLKIHSHFVTRSIITGFDLSPT